MRDRATSGASPLGPSAIEIGARSLRLPDGVCASFLITGYPAEVTPGWLEPLLTYPGHLDVSLHIEPLPPAVAAQHLRRRLTRLESGRRLAADRGHLDDPTAEAATEDAHELAARLARSETRLFRVGMYLTVHAFNADELDTEVSRVRALAASLLLDAQPATFRALSGWSTTLPLGIDSLNVRRTFDTDASAACFPFTSPDLPVPADGGGVLYGLNLDSAGPVIWDRFTLDNHNAVILAASGAGKSYLAKLEILRSLYTGIYTGIEVAVVDPEGEYAPLCQATGGAHIALGSPGVHVNPLDLSGTQLQADAFTRRAMFCHTLIAVLADIALDSAAKAALDHAIITTYHNAGITTDPRTWGRPAPLLSDLSATLRASGAPAASGLADHLAPYVTGTHRGLFDGPTTTRPRAHLTVYDLAAVTDELRPAAHLLALDHIWRHVTNPRDRKPRLVVVDEAWTLASTPEGARFLWRLAKTARKYQAGLTCITQDAEDLLSTDLGRAVVTNAATQILLKQAAQAINHVGDAFHLTDGERAFLLTAQRGEALLTTQNRHVAFYGLASPAEHRLIEAGSPASPGRYEPDSPILDPISLNGDASHEQ